MFAFFVIQTGFFSFPYLCVEDTLLIVLLHKLQLSFIDGDNSKLSRLFLNAKLNNTKSQHGPICIAT